MKKIIPHSMIIAIMATPVVALVSCAESSSTEQQLYNESDFFVYADNSWDKAGFEALVGKFEIDYKDSHFGDGGFNGIKIVYTDMDTHYKKWSENINDANVADVFLLDLDEVLEANDEIQLSAFNATGVSGEATFADFYSKNIYQFEKEDGVPDYGEVEDHFLTMVRRWEDNYLVESFSDDASTRKLYGIPANVNPKINYFSYNVDTPPSEKPVTDPDAVVGDERYVQPWVTKFVANLSEYDSVNPFFNMVEPLDVDGSNDGQIFNINDIVNYNIFTGGLFLNPWELSETPEAIEDTNPDETDPEPIENDPVPVKNFMVDGFINLITSINSSIAPTTNSFKMFDRDIDVDGFEKSFIETLSLYESSQNLERGESLFGNASTDFNLIREMLADGDYDNWRHEYEFRALSDFEYWPKYNELSYNTITNEASTMTLPSYAEEGDPVRYAQQESGQVWVKNSRVISSFRNDLANEFIGYLLRPSNAKDMFDITGFVSPLIGGQQKLNATDNGLHDDERSVIDAVYDTIGTNHISDTKVVPSTTLAEQKLIGDAWVEMTSPLEKDEEDKYGKTGIISMLLKSMQNAATPRPYSIDDAEYIPSHGEYYSDTVAYYAERIAQTFYNIIKMKFDEFYEENDSGDTPEETPEEDIPENPDESPDNTFLG